MRQHVAFIFGVVSNSYETHFPFINPLSIKTSMPNRKVASVWTCRAPVITWKWEIGRWDYLSIDELFVRAIIWFENVIRHENQEIGSFLIYRLRFHVIDRSLFPRIPLSKSELNQPFSILVLSVFIMFIIIINFNKADFHQKRWRQSFISFWYKIL